MKMFHIYLIFGICISSAKTQTFSRMFRQGSAFTQSWKTTRSNITNAKTLSECSVFCLQNIDTCSAFQFSNSKCDLGMSESVIMLPDNYDPKVSKIVWKDENVPLTPHMLLSSASTTIDVSLDVLNSPPIVQKSVTCMSNVLFGVLGQDYSLTYYGFYVDGYGNVNYYMSSSSFGSTTCTRITKNIHGRVAGFGWVGNKFWIVGGDTNAVGTDYFEDTLLKKGPAYPVGSYPGSFTYPCITSVDDNTGLIISGMYGTTIYTSVKSYNFTSGVWKNLTDTPFKRRSFACMRVTLSSGKDVVLVIGGKTADNKAYVASTQMYDIESNTWSNTTYNLPLPSAFGKAVMINNRLFYVGGISSPASNNIYEWNEVQGWTLFDQITAFLSNQYLAVIPYNF